MVIADDNAPARIFATHDIARDSICDDTRVRKGEILGNDAAPTVGPEFDCGCQEVSIREGKRRPTARTLSSHKSNRIRKPLLQKILAIFLFDPFDEFCDLLGPLARANQEGVGSFHDDKIVYSNGGNEF